MNSMYDDDDQDAFYEKHWPSNRKPTFPYVARASGVELPFGLVFGRRHVTTRGSDPYAGEEWTLEARNFSVRLSNVVAFSLEVRCFKWRFSRYGDKLPWYARVLWNFLEYRHQWHQLRDPVPDAHAYLESRP